MCLPNAQEGQKRMSDKHGTIQLCAAVWLHPLEEQQALISNEPPLQPLKHKSTLEVWCKDLDSRSWVIYGSPDSTVIEEVCCSGFSFGF